MANDSEQSGQLNLTVVALVALVAIVGLVALVMNAASLSTISTGGAFVSAADDENLMGQASSGKTRYATGSLFGNDGGGGDTGGSCGYCGDTWQCTSIRTESECTGSCTWNPGCD